VAVADYGAVAAVLHGQVYRAVKDQYQQVAHR